MSTKLLLIAAAIVGLNISAMAQSPAPAAADQKPAAEKPMKKEKKTKKARKDKKAKAGDSAAPAAPAADKK